MRNFTIFTVLITLILMSSILFAKTYYVSDLFGDDTNDGLSDATPFATIQKAADVMTAGDKVIIDFGEYYESIFPKNNGTAGNPIVYEAKEDVTVLGDADFIIPIFLLHAGNVYVMENVFRTIQKFTEDGAVLAKKSALSDLDTDTGIYHDRAANKLYIRSSNDADPAAHTDSLFFEPYAFDIVEGSYITIDGFNLKNKINAIVAENLIPLPGLEIKNNVFAFEDKDVSSTAIDIDGGEADTVNTYEEFLISNNIFENNAGIILRSAGRNSIISDNTFNGNTELGEAGTEIIGLRASADYPGTQFQGLVIEKNFFNDNNHRVAYFRSGGDLEDITVRNNIVFGGHFGTMRVRNGKNINILNNTFFYCNKSSHMIRFGDGVTGIGYNNIFALPQGSYTWFVDNSNDTTLFVDIDYNYYVTDTSITSSRDDQLLRIRVAANGVKINRSDVPGGPNAIYGHPMAAQPDTIINMKGDTVVVNEIPDMNQPALSLFVDPDTLAATPEKLRLVEGCKAINVAYAPLAPPDDFYGNLRDDKPDIGAIEYGATGIMDISDIFPSDYTLSNNYPNPFNPETTIEYKLPKSGRIRLTVYNIMGQKITTLYSGIQKIGTHTAKWNGLDDKGTAVPSGIYIYRLEAGSITKSAKMMLLR